MQNLTRNRTDEVRKVGLNEESSIYGRSDRPQNVSEDNDLEGELVNTFLIGSCVRTWFKLCIGQYTLYSLFTGIYIARPSLQRSLAYCGPSLGGNLGFSRVLHNRAKTTTIKNPK